MMNLSLVNTLEYKNAKKLSTVSLFQLCVTSHYFYFFYPKFCYYEMVIMGHKYVFTDVTYITF